jgi:hypothetical protein
MAQKENLKECILTNENLSLFHAVILSAPSVWLRWLRKIEKEGIKNSGLDVLLIKPNTG